MRECLANFETPEKEIQFTKVCEDASFWKRPSIGMCYKTIADRTPACREYTHPRPDSDSRKYAAIPRQTIIGPVIQVHIFQFLGTHGIQIQIPSTTTSDRNSWVVIYRGKNRFVDELHLRDPEHHPAIHELLLERSIAKESEPCSTELEQSRIEETHATQFEIPTNLVYYSKEVAPVAQLDTSHITPTSKTSIAHTTAVVDDERGHTKGEQDRINLRIRVPLSRKRTRAV